MLTQGVVYLCVHVGNELLLMPVNEMIVINIDKGSNVPAGKAIIVDACAIDRNQLIIDSKKRTSLILTNLGIGLDALQAPQHILSSL
jgi:hypothetical protein